MPGGLRPHFTSFIAENDRVAVEFTGNATLRNGESYCNEYCMTYQLKDGKIVHGNEYYCTILADERIGPLLAEAQAEAMAEAGDGA